MTELKRKGNLAELVVAADLVRRGYQVAFPFGEDSDFDLLFVRDECVERVQVKHTTSDGRTIVVKCFSHSLTKGKVRATKRYTARTVDWIAVYDATTKRCFYVPAAELGENGRSLMHLRLVPARSGRLAGIHMADEYADV